MRFNSFNDAGCVFHIVYLSTKVLIELASSSSQSVLLVFVVVSFEMINKSGSHVIVLFARSQTGIKKWATPFLEGLSHKPSRSNDQEEVNHDESNSLLGILDEGRVQMHMVLRVEVVVNNCVNIFQVDQSSMLVGFLDFGIGSVEMSSTNCSGHHSRSHGSWSHCSGKQEEMWI